VGDTLHGNMAPSKVEGLVIRVHIEKQKAEREAARP
jgi:NADH-quinone oxidoreductase subunit E